MSYTLDKRMFSVLSTSLEYAENNTTQTSSAVRSFASLYRIEIDQNLGEISRGFGGKEWSKNKIVHKTSGFRFGCGMTALSFNILYLKPGELSGQTINIRCVEGMAICMHLTSSCFLAELFTATSQML